MKYSVDYLKPFLFFIVVTLITLSVSRMGLLAWQYDRVAATDGLAYILLQGIRFDIILLALVLVIPLSLTPLILSIKALNKPWLWFIKIYLVFMFVEILFTELATPNFIAQYDLRPNILYVEYLKYPKEVFSTLWEAYRAELIGAVLFSTAMGVWVYKNIARRCEGIQPVTFLNALIMAPLLLVVCVMAGRSTLDHRAVNPSTVSFSSDPLVNTLPLSSAYSVLYAIYELRYENKGNLQYGKMPEDEMIARVRREMHIDPADFVSDKLPTLHRQQASFQRKRPLNLVIILEESLGAEFVGSLGGLPLTPELDALKNQGIWFENMYATGTRSVRGIEAVVTGFTPTPSRSVVKLSKSQRNFFTLAQLLSQYDYDTSFIYGGEAHFDNMRRFFANNGFKKIIDENDYEQPVFTGSWGVSDEDLFNKAHQTFLNYPADKPFFSLVFSSSNHSPFEFPDGRIKQYDKKKQTVNNAVKYADYALGQFIEKARHSPYWKNTVFLIIADHNSRVYGAELVPVKRFHIPALILGGAIKPQLYNGLASQIDMPPTLLSLMGISSTHPAIGHDLSRDIFSKIPGRAIMQFSTTQAYMQGDGQIVIMQKSKQPSLYTYQNGKLQASTKRNDDLIKTAVAHSIWPMLAYRKGLYRLPKSDGH